jgi:UDP:flavonoid glycosyltransferase YjiC (YdhE family)
MPRRGAAEDRQGDEALAAAAIEALREGPVRVIVTPGDASPAGLPSAADVRCERFVPHGPVLRRVIEAGAVPAAQSTSRASSTRE